MPNSRNGWHIRISASACILAAMLLLILPLQWIVAALAAAAVHELFHIGAVYLCGGQIWEFRIQGSGARMCAAGLSPGKNIFCSLAGPLGGLTLLLFLKWIPRTAICAAFQSAYNLLPVRPLDGGRAMHSLLHWIFPRSAERLCRYTEWGCVTVVFLFALYCAIFLKLGLMPIFLAIALYLRIKS